ncbi:MAG: VanZ family protein [Chitinophagaceae bacterium]
MQERFRFLIPAILWFITCSVLFTLPGSAFPKENWFDLIWFDKWVHIGLISILVFLVCWGVYRFNSRRLSDETILWVVAVASFYGLLMEFVQLYFVANRSFDGGDVVADTVGAVAAGLFVRWKWAKK